MRRRFALRGQAHRVAISKHTTTIFAKLDIVPGDDTNRRVRAVLTYLDAGHDEADVR